MLRRLTALVAAVLLLGALAACGDDDDDEDAGGGGQDTTEEIQEISITATEQGAQRTFEAPSSAEGGLVKVTLKNDGKLEHDAELLLIGDTPQAQFMDDFDKATDEEGAPIPSYLKPAGGPVGVEPGETVDETIRLPAGKYVIVCTLSDADTTEEEAAGEEEGTEQGGEDEAGQEEPNLPPHYRQGMISALTVTGPSDPPIPEGDAVIEGFDYGFRVPALTAGKKELVFHNTSTAQVHHALFFKFPAGTTPDKIPGILQQAFEAEGPPSGPPPFEEEGGSAVFGEGNAGTFEVELSAGQYAVLCFIQDRSGGPPHAIGKQMITPFTVS